MLPLWAVSVDKRPPHCWLSRCVHRVSIDDCIGPHGDSNQEQHISVPSSLSRLCVTSLTNVDTSGRGIWL
jgi:hypothetical protein